MFEKHRRRIDSKIKNKLLFNILHNNNIKISNKMKSKQDNNNIIPKILITNPIKIENMKIITEESNTTISTIRIIMMIKNNIKIELTIDCMKTENMKRRMKISHIKGKIIKTNLLRKNMI